MSIENLKRHRAGVETINGVIKTVNRLDLAARTLGQEQLSTTLMYIADDLTSALTDMCESFDAQLLEAVQGATQTSAAILNATMAGVISAKRE